MDENNTGFQNFIHSERALNSISLKNFSLKNHFSSNSESRREKIGETGGKRNIEEESHQKISTIKRGVCKQLIFLVKKKDEGQRPAINLCKLGLKDAYFSVPFKKSLRQFVLFRLSENLYDFLYLHFGLGLAL